MQGKEKKILTHRAMYELYVGQIPLDLTIDHLCRNTACGNPKHLRILTLLENCKDNGWARKTHCPQGHEYTVENTYYEKRNNGKLRRHCRTCRQESNHRRSQEQHGQGRPPRTRQAPAADRVTSANLRPGAR